MKNLFKSALLTVVTALMVSCTQSESPVSAEATKPVVVANVVTAPTIQTKVKAYLASYLDDPKSYEEVSWGIEKKLRQSAIDSNNADIMLSGKKLDAYYRKCTDTTVVGHQIGHVFRAKNKMGGLVKSQQWFRVMNNGTVVMDRYPL